MEDIEREIVDFKLKETSTSKEGISTWILLSGAHSTEQPDAKGPAYKIENNQKLDKIAKIRDAAKPQRLTTVKTDIKNKLKSTTPMMLTSIMANTTKPTKSGLKKKPTQQVVELSEVPLKSATKPKPHLTTTTQKTTSTSLADEIVSTTIEATTKEVPVPFLILEPKDADFDLPQDRSPGKPTTKKPKRPPTKANKKKNGNKKPIDEKVDDVKNNNTKIANKIKEKPMSTKIYNYLSREIMPTVGVGLLGLVVTAGLAGYFFGPLGTLRRSYDVAERKDDLYFYNNEEYAGPGADGQSEEEIFGKVIAGMPNHANHYRNNIRYVQNPQQQLQQQQQRPNQFHQPAPKYSQQYNRYRNAGFPQQHGPQKIIYSANPHMMPNHLPVHHTRNHLMNPVNPANVISQKSISSPIFAVPAAPPSPSTTTTTTTTTSEPLPSIVYSTQTEKNPEPAENHVDSTEYFEDSPNELKRRSQFVVGSVLPESIDVDAAETSAAVPEHGPRRRKRAVLSVQKEIDTNVKELENSNDKLKLRIETSEKNEKISKEIKHIDYELGRLRRVIAEIKDIELFQDELHIESKNAELRDTVSNGIVHIKGDILFVNELLDNPTDIDVKMANRQDMIKTMTGDHRKIDHTNDENEKKADPSDYNSLTTEGTSTTTTTDFNQFSTERPSGLLGILKLIELKAAFGVNVLRSIRPAFDRAFEDVFRVNQTQI